MLKGEWLDTLDRLERLAGRLAKRQEREVGLLTPAATPPQPAGDGSDRPSPAMVEVMKRRGQHQGPAGR